MAQGLLNVDPLTYYGLGLLAESGPSTQPNNLGRGLLMGAQMAQQGQAAQIAAQRANTMQQLTDLQLQQMKDRQAAIKQFSGGLSAMGPGTDPNTGITWQTGRQGVQQTAMPGMTPQLAQLMQTMPAEDAYGLYQQMLAKSVLPKDPVKLGAGESLIDPSTGQAMVTLPDKPPAGFTRGPDGKLTVDPNWLDAQQRIRAAGASQNKVILPPQEIASERTIGEAIGKIYSDLQNTAMSANSQISKWKQLGGYLDQVNTGKLTPTTQQIKSYAKGFGIDLNAIGVKDDVGPAQAAQALANEMALQLRNPAGGAGMPGALSDKDREFLTSMVPNLSGDPEGRKLLINWNVRLLERQKQLAKIARNHYNKAGKADSTLIDRLEEFAQANPLFNEQDMQVAQQLSQRGGGTSTVIRYDAQGNRIQ